MSALLTVICSASTVAVRASAFPLDEELDAPGRDRAAAMRLRRVDAAWTSPALRARQTAAALGIDAAAESALRDVDFGIWAGRLLADVAAADPDGAAAWMSDPAATPHGGESVLDVLVRTRDWLASLGGDGRIVAVTHPAIARACVVTALDASPAAFWRIDAGPLCSVRLRGAAGRWTLVALGTGE